jgi:NTP pyrophosphatase (non-canonical NTP hydrolase)
MTKICPDCQAEVLSTSQPDHSTLEAMAETIHKARWPADRQMDITPFADEDKNGREYCFRIARAALAATPAVGGEAFQKRVHAWMMECFSMEICRDRQERNHRFIEEALELVQACGCTASEAHQLVDYVYGRDQGDINQEVGGVMVTLAALCLANDIDMHSSGETELARVWTKIDQIMAKQAGKPKHSPLPQSVAAQPASPLPEPDWKATAESANAAASRVIEDARVDPETKRIPMGLASPLRGREIVEALVKALNEIANHPESKKSTRIDESSYGVGWAFWNVQHIARDAIRAFSASPPEQPAAAPVTEGK